MFSNKKLEAAIAENREYSTKSVSDLRTDVSAALSRVASRSDIDRLSNKELIEALFKEFASVKEIK